MRNILIVGAPKVGKTNLAKKISQELGYIYINLDLIFESVEELNCWPYPKYHDANIISKELAGFVVNYINHLDDNRYVLEGAYIDIESIYSKINNTMVIGLTYNELDQEKLFNNIKKHNQNDWISKFNDRELLEKCDCFIKRNKYYQEVFKKLNILTYDLSKDYQIKMKEIVNDLKKEYINQKIDIVIDRPLGSKHPKHDMIYEVNYGYLPNTISGDGEELDAYVLGEFKPLEEFTGKVIAIIHRTNDDDDKLVVTKDGNNYTDDQIRALTEFQERYFESEIYRYEDINNDKCHKKRK
jgi:inorganic pyrophosphatase